MKFKIWGSTFPRNIYSNTLKLLIMNTQTLAAALNLAWAVASRDGMEDSEWAVMIKEMKSFNMTDEQVDRVTKMFKEMDVLDAVKIIRDADTATRREAQALIILTVIGDGDLSDKEAGAFLLMKLLCQFDDMDIETAHRVIGF